ncbi:WYL domain-containing protein [Tsukamurella sp. 8F]|uniref:helix-turn-helix transcriptional regulator n=1 Tax=unclassified Tsukamurella TaxID=2633480 RepID=UPI0023B8C8AD|nr:MULTISPECIES: WYL domain-containing protein [unclassified Tsukamurella]MDF0530547.1 WYL domain-containing protein [Tsukamurella sp. 8J]MDF0586803.1 WYL domain-containing protein [Tsukamurella sp. 8F]
MAKTQRIARLFNLLIYLKWTTRYVSAQTIREKVDGYEDQSDDAFNRMFERDKKDLREMGIPLEIGKTSRINGEDGYRIRPDEYEMDPIDLDPDESAAVAVAAAMWGSSELTQANQAALVKLKASGIEVDGPGAAAGLSTPLAAGSGAEAALSRLLAGITEHRVVRFAHRPDRTRPFVDRTLHPWAVITRRGTWYLVGHDAVRDGVRIFKGSRIGAVSVLDDPATVTPPEGFDARDELADTLSQYTDGEGEARIWLAPGRGNALRRAASSSAESEFRDRPGTEVTVRIGSVENTARQVAGLGPDAVVLEPPELRDAVIVRLTGAAGAGKA